VVDLADTEIIQIAERHKAYIDGLNSNWANNLVSVGRVSFIRDFQSGVIEGILTNDLSKVTQLIRTNSTYSFP